ncbi:MAG: hypothetical protein R6U10_00030 [Thermoplasmatota archaeon]
MNKTIVVIDDEPDIQAILKAYLERIDDVEVVEALSGEDGVDTYHAYADRGDPPALVVMDLNLSGSNQDEDIIVTHRLGEGDDIDGVETARRIFDVNADAVIWGYTAWADTDWGDRLRATGAQKVVDRIVTFKEFAGMIQQLLEKTA